MKAFFAIIGAVIAQAVSLAEITEWPDHPTVGDACTAIKNEDLCNLSSPVCQFCPCAIEVGCIGGDDFANCAHLCFKKMAPIIFPLIFLVLCLPCLCYCVCFACFIAVFGCCCPRLRRDP